jgi:hypothetical protein
MLFCGGSLSDNIGISVNVALALYPPNINIDALNSVSRDILSPKIYKPNMNGNAMRHKHGMPI